MFALGAFTRVSIEIDGHNSYLCANACKWHLKKEDHCDLFDQDLRREKYQSKHSRCMECHLGTAENPYISVAEKFVQLTPERKNAAE
jgi:hypothetical protein